ncbi:MAG TPA: Sec-independent protein translocase protein TatB [Rhodocyclaceae bacterium]|nr:Sec-independent protein translocase protein TatB [Rhodocyclaceae bacterium]
MFDFGFSELLLIAVVALIVVGPERLPKVARTAGHLLGRLQRYVSDVKSDISREMQLEDLKKLQQQVEQQARELEGSMRSQMRSVEADLGKTAGEIKQDLSLADDRTRLQQGLGEASSDVQAPCTAAPEGGAAAADAQRAAAAPPPERDRAAANKGPAERS